MPDPKSLHPQAPGFIRGVNLKSQISNLKSNDSRSAGLETQTCDRMFEDIASAAASTEYQPEDLADSTQIWHCRSSLAFLPRRCYPQTRRKQAQTWMLENWLDDSIGIATRFVDYEFRPGAGKHIELSVLGQFSDSIDAAPVRY
ncbi:hypothetical protein [Microcoleus vaginatus]|uniref:hypothetical protein n=1 Tax=Microcoleus vaginatus TaxID=119532 RepID=UPI0032AC1DF5